MAKLCRIEFAVLCVMLLASLCEASLLFSDDFGNGAGGWILHGRSIEIIDNHDSYGKMLKISRSDSNGFTYVEKEYTGFDGSLVLEAEIAFRGVARGSKNYYRGKFQAVVVRNGKEIAWLNDDFDGDYSNFVPRQCRVDDLSKTDVVSFRIGLQNAKGEVYVDNVKIRHEP